MSKLQCGACGTNNADHWTFCTECGTKLVIDECTHKPLCEVWCDYEHNEQMRVKKYYPKSSVKYKLCIHDGSLKVNTLVKVVDTKGLMRWQCKHCEFWNEFRCSHKNMEKIGCPTCDLTYDAYIRETSESALRQGTGLRVVKVPDRLLHDHAAMKSIQKMLENVGTNQTIIIPKDVDIEIDPNHLRRYGE